LYPGANKFARTVGLTVFAGIVLFTTAEWLVERQSLLRLTSVDVERNLRGAETILLGALLLVIAYYGVSIGRNLRGIILGYGLYIALDVMFYATRSFLGHSFQSAFSVVRSYSYLVALLVWAVALWSYSPVSVPEAPARLEDDYQSLAMATRQRLGAVRSYLGRAGGQ
jgi:hypothetical protein